MQPIPSPENADDADQYPEGVEQGVGSIFLERRAPRQHHGIYRVEYPDEHERTGGAHPAHQRKAENTHQYTGHFDVFDVFQDEAIGAGERHGEARRLVRCRARTAVAVCQHQSSVRHDVRR